MESSVLVNEYDLELSRHFKKLLILAYISLVFDVYKALEVPLRRDKITRIILSISADCESVSILQ